MAICQDNGIDHNIYASGSVCTITTAGSYKNIDAGGAIVSSVIRSTGAGTIINANVAGGVFDILAETGGHGIYATSGAVINLGGASSTVTVRGSSVSGVPGVYGLFAEGAGSTLNLFGGFEVRSEGTTGRGVYAYNQGRINFDGTGGIQVYGLDVGIFTTGTNTKIEMNGNNNILESPGVALQTWSNSIVNMTGSGNVFKGSSNVVDVQNSVVNIGDNAEFYGTVAAGGSLQSKIGNNSTIYISAVGQSATDISASGTGVSLTIGRDASSVNRIVRQISNTRGVSTRGGGHLVFNGHTIVSGPADVPTTNYNAMVGSNGGAITLNGSLSIVGSISYGINMGSGGGSANGSVLTASGKVEVDASMVSAVAVSGRGARASSVTLNGGATLVTNNIGGSGNTRGVILASNGGEVRLNGTAAYTLTGIGNNVTGIYSGNVATAVYGGLVDGTGATTGPTITTTGIGGYGIQIDGALSSVKLAQGTSVTTQNAHGIYLNNGVQAGNFVLGSNSRVSAGGAGNAAIAVAGGSSYVYAGGLTLDASGAGGSLLLSDGAGSSITINSVVTSVNAPSAGSWGLNVRNGASATNTVNANVLGGRAIQVTGANSLYTTAGTAAGSRVVVSSSGKVAFSNTAAVGSLEGTAGGTVQWNSGALTIGETGALYNTAIDMANYAGSLSDTNKGGLIKVGGFTQILSGVNNIVGTVAVQAGKLEFTQAGVFTVDGNYTTYSRATTRVGATNSTLDISGTFEQQTDSILSVQIGATPDIKAGAVKLAGSLEITGFTFTGTDNLASTVLANDYQLIQSGSVIQGNFDLVDGIGTSSADYLVIGGFFDPTHTQYWLNTSLSWYSQDPARATGNFTMEAGSGFTVDVLLEDQAATANWDGKSLTKRGPGRLELKYANTYTGSTTVVDGYLRTTFNNAIASSSGLTVQTPGNFNLEGTEQEVKALSGDGSVSLRGGILTVNTAPGSTSTFAGIIDDGQRSGPGTIISDGSLLKDGDGTLILTGENEYAGTTAIRAGTLQIGDGGTSGSLASSSVDNDATLAFNHSNTLNYTGKIAGAGSLSKQGSGLLLLTGLDSYQANVSAEQGTLEFAQAGVFTVDGNYTTLSGATTRIGASNSNLDVKGVFDQQAGSELIVQIGASPDIKADSAKLAGTLDITGFTLGSTTPNTASTITANSYLLIQTKTGIDGTYSNIGGAGSSSLDYLIADGFLDNLDTMSGKYLDYRVGFTMAWNSPSQTKGTGKFTMEAGSGFTVDVLLADQNLTPGYYADWDGKSLTKRGAGRLELAFANSYTGETTIEEGYVRTAVDNAIAISSGLIISGSSGIASQGATGTANFNLQRTAQSVQSLNGTGSLSLTGGQLTVNTATGSTSIFSGIIDDGLRSGPATIVAGGTLTKAGDGTLILSGENEYLGTTTISSGTLQIGNGGTSGSLASASIANSSSLIFNRSDASTYAGVLSGAGSLTKRGDGVLALSGVGSGQGTVIVEAGTLQFTQTGAFATSAGYITKTNAVTHIGKNGSTLNISGIFTQESGSMLVVQTGNPPNIVADSASLAGTLDVTGFSYGTEPVRASDIAGRSYALIRTTNGITGSFDRTIGATGVSSLDYLVTHDYLSDDGKDYNLGFRLAWTDNDARYGTGFFTMAAGTGFDVDLSLQDQTMPAGGFVSGWDGKSLLKKGEGTLILSKVNSYTGLTDVSGGVLELTANQALGVTSSLSVRAGATVKLFNATHAGGTSQSVGSLTTIAGSRIDFGGGTLTITDTQRAAGMTSGGLVGHDTLFGAGSLVIDPSIMPFDGIQAGFTGTVTVTGGSTAVVNSAAAFNSAVGTGGLAGIGINLEAGNDTLIFGDLSLHSTASVTGTTSGVARMVIAGAGQVQVLDGISVAFAANNIYTGGTIIGSGSSLSLGAGAGGSASGWITGDVLDNGSFVFNRSDANVFGGVISGSGSLSHTGTGTTTLAAASSYSGATTISAGKLAAGAANIFSPVSGFSTGTGGELALSGFSQTLASLDNAGTVSFGSNPGTILTVTGNYTSNGGALLINSVLGDNLSVTDKLIAGSVSLGAGGATRIFVSNVGGLGALTTGDGIELVHINGGAAASQAGAFVLGRPVKAGAYEYALFRNGVSQDGNWYLRSGGGGGGAYRAEVPVNMASAMVAARFNITMLGTYDDRAAAYTGGRFGSSSDNLLRDKGFAQPPSNFMWGRIFGETGHSGRSGSEASFRKNGPSYDYNMGGFQVGMDLYRGETESGSLNIAGLYVGAGRMKGMVDRPGGGKAGHTSMDGYSVGAYWTHKNALGWYIDTVGQVTLYNNASASSVDGQSSKTNGWGFTGSVEGGYPIALGNGWVATPQIQLIYQHLSFAKSHDAFGTIAYKDSNAFYGRIGGKLGKDWTLESGRTISTFAYANLWHGFGAKATTTFNTFDGLNAVAMRSNLGGTWGQVGFGLSSKINKNINAFASVDYNFSLDGKKRSGIGGKIGMVINW